MSWSRIYSSAWERERGKRGTSPKVNCIREITRKGARARERARERERVRARARERGADWEREGLY